VNPSDVYSVMILRRERLAKGLEGVWQSVAQADAAAQRIVVSGDSAARSAALAEAAARRAVIDSMARANGAPPLGAVDSARAVAPAPRPVPVRRPPPVDTAPRDTVRRDSVRPPDTTIRPAVPR
jgi:hypothetical protein